MGINKYFAILICFIFVSEALFSETPHTIRWKGIKSASGYTLEIKDESGKTEFHNSKEPRVTVKLGQGKFSYRIAVLNKLKHIEKWSNWNELEVRPISPPIINTSAAGIETTGAEDKISFTGENIYEGTKAIVVQDDNKFNAKVDTSRDGKTSVVTVDTKKIDKSKTYHIVLENKNFDPIEVPVAGKESELLDPSELKEITGQKESNTTSGEPEANEPVNSYNRLWPLVWRQAILPGWGHNYHGDHKTSYGYFGLLGAAAINTGYQEKEYKSLLHDRNTTEDYVESIRATNPTGLVVPYLYNSYSQRLANQRTQLNDSLGAIAAIYATSIVHIIFTGTKNASGLTRKHSMWEMFWHQAILPGWGHYIIGDRATAYGYFGVLGAAVINTGYQDKEYKSLLSDRNTTEDHVESIRATDPTGLVVPYLFNNYSERLSNQRTQLNDSLGIIGAVYATSLVHILITGHTRKYEGNSSQSFNFGIRPDEQVSPFRVFDPNHLRVDLKYGFIFN